MIVYRDPAVRPVVFAIGPEIDQCSDSEILARFNDWLRASAWSSRSREAARNSTT